MYRISVQTDIMHGSCLLMDCLLQSMSQRKQSFVFQLLEVIVFHILWIMSESIQRGHYDPSQGDDGYNPGKVVKLVIGWMMTPQIVGFDCFGGSGLSHVQTELKVNGGAQNSHASSIDSVQYDTDFVFKSPVLYD